MKIRRHLSCFFCKNKNYSIFLDTNIYIFGKIKNGQRMDGKL